ncbi:MAG: matrixin family metalloprotease [Gemmatimonadetes bacterium]|nr:matrixin family metalloprotease [Gemmatimonadota bacterium]NIR79024.1 matrixin family metalloprotease [Gemmatimonadota bacterium]NIT87671.1 matrixin family metalloprotease [Gemmatimonadota bacterium]NIU31542.1 matrixin family metalloprotease [Gemmatimonadota bacterium]NIU36194.1 matrixin family metalloprotease [Gemmatimonadota bacterium]
MTISRAFGIGLLSALVPLAWSRGGGPFPSDPGTGGATARGPAGAQERSFGSAVPCAVPLRWRIGDVDSRFELDERAAEAAMREAAGLWERATGRELFSHAPGSGFPVRFEFDDRQALLQVRRRLEEELQSDGESLESRRGELAALGERFQAARAEYQERLAAFERRLEALNGEIRRWNERGGAPDSVRAPLRERAAGFEEEGRALERHRRELQGVQEWLAAATEDLNEEIRGRNRRAEALQRASAVTAMEAGRYGETVTTQDGEVVAVRREIRVFRFDGREDLVTLLAHELGHALGLGHSGVPGSVMHEITPGRPESPRTPELHPRDVEMLRERCPGL